MYPEFAKALRAMNKAPADIGKMLGCSKRQAFEYLAGRKLPPASVLLRHPDLTVAALRDVPRETRELQAA